MELKNIFQIHPADAPRQNWNQNRLKKRRFRSLRFILKTCLLLGLVGNGIPAWSAPSPNDPGTVWTQHNNNARTGANLQEDPTTGLKVSTVNAANFGKLFSIPVNGDVFAQPLRVSNVNIPGVGIRNVIYVATVRNHVYALDADNLTVSGQPITFWHRDLTPSGEVPLHRTMVGPNIKVQINVSFLFFSFPITTVDMAQYKDFGDYLGIVGSPVIKLDPSNQANNAMYLVARTVRLVTDEFPQFGNLFANYGIFKQRLHALNITDGTERSDYNSPVLIGNPNLGDFTRVITASAQTFAFPVGLLLSSVSFPQGVNNFQKNQNQRSALALGGPPTNPGSLVYVAWAAHADFDPYHGRIFAYQANNLTAGGSQTPLYKFNATPDVDGIKGDALGHSFSNLFDIIDNIANFLKGDYYIGNAAGGIWQAGQGPAIDDTTGNLFVMNGNGHFNKPSGNDLGCAFIKLNSQLSTSSLDYFVPSNQQLLNDKDYDLGSAGCFLIPGTNFVMGGGKECKFYLLDKNNLGGYTPSDSGVLQEFFVNDSVIANNYPELVPFPPIANITNHVHGSPVYWEDSSGTKHVYVWPENEFLRAYSFNGSFSTTPQGGHFVGNPEGSSLMKVVAGMPGGILSVSAAGASDGIVWASLPLGNANLGTVRGILRAFKAVPNGGTLDEIWNSEQAGSDAVGNFSKFCAPTVGGGKVYLATFSDKLDVYGPLAVTRPTQTFQAETACRYDGNAESVNSGFNGTGYVNMGTEGNGAAIVWALNAAGPSPETVSLTFRYQKSSPGNTPMALRLDNNTTDLGTVSFTHTSGTTWGTANVVVAIPAGSHLLRLVATNNNPLPSIDEMSFISSTVTPGTCPPLISLQAENACKYDGVVETTNSGFTGTGYVNMDTEGNGAAIVWALNAAGPSPETVSLTFRYQKSSAGNTPMALRLDNNTTDLGTVSFAPTSGTAWGSANVVVTIPAGSHLLRLVATNNSPLPSIDEMSFISSTITPGTCPPVVFLQAETACKYDGVVETANSGFTGTGYVNLDQRNSAIAWALNVPGAAPQVVTLSFRYRKTAGGTSDLALRLDNSTTDLTTVSFVPTPGSVWGTVNVVVTLPAGDHVVQLVATSPGGSLPDVDKLSFLSSTVMAGTCPPLVVMQAEDACEHDGTIATGGGATYVDLPNNNGSSISWAVNVAGTTNQVATLAFRYRRTSAGSLSMALRLDANTTNLATVSFGNTNGTGWGTAIATVTLPPGSHTLRLVSTNNLSLPDIDKVSFLSPTITAGPCPTVMQAEDACDYDGTLVGGANQFVNLTEGVGSSIVWAVNVAGPGNQTIVLTFRYSKSGGGTTTMQLRLDNNATNLGSVAFGPTGGGGGGGGTFARVDSTSITLPPGDHVLRLVSTTTSTLPNIDWVSFTSSNITVRACPPVNCCLLAVAPDWIEPVMAGQAHGIVVDTPNQRIYVTDTVSPDVKVLDYNGNSVAAPGPGFSGYANPMNLALDSLGNVYVAQRNGATSGEIWKIDSSSWTKTPFATSLANDLRSIYVDSLGNVYAGSDHGEVYIFNAAGVLQTSINLGPIGAPTGMIKDGNILYVAHTQEYRIVSYTEGTPYSYTPSTPFVVVPFVASNPNHPYGMVMDLPSRNVYVANAEFGTVIFQVSTAGVWTELRRCSNGALNYGLAMALDENKAQYVGVSQGGVEKIVPCLSTALSLAAGGPTALMAKVKSASAAAPEEVETSGSEEVGTPTITPTPTVTPTPTPDLSKLPLIAALPNISRNGEPINIRVNLKQAGQVTLLLFTLTGEQVYQTTYQGEYGLNDFIWKVENQQGSSVASGIYLYHLRLEDGTTQTGKVAVIR